VEPKGSLSNPLAPVDIDLSLNSSLMGGVERVQWILGPALLCDPNHATSRLWALDAHQYRNTGFKEFFPVLLPRDHSSSQELCPAKMVARTPFLLPF
jgi:hypothetical protein